MILLSLALAGSSFMGLATRHVGENYVPPIAKNGNFYVPDYNYVEVDRKPAAPAPAKNDYYLYGYPYASNGYYDYYGYYDHFGYYPYDSRYYDYYGYGYRDANGFLGSYILGGYYGIDRNNTKAYLGGISAPRYLLRDVTVNNTASGVRLIGRSFKAGEDKSLLIGSTGSRIDFGEMLGRASDKSLCLTVSAVGTGVALNDQVYLGLFGRLDQFRKLRKEGLESLAFVDATGSVRVTVKLSDLLSDAEEAFKEKKASLSSSSLYLGMQPASGTFKGTQTADIYTIKAYVVTDRQNIEISSLLSDAHVIVRTNSGEVSRLVATKADKKVSVTGRTFISEPSGDYTTGYMPWGSTFTAIY